MPRPYRARRWLGGQIDPFDDWNKEKKPGDMDRWLLPRQVLKPRNLRAGIYRGGRRPLDFYRRVHAGILGAQMPGRARQWVSRPR